VSCISGQTPAIFIHMPLPDSGERDKLWEAIADQESRLQGIDPPIIVLEGSVLIRGYGSFRITRPPSVPRIADTAGDSREPRAAWPSGIRTACICNSREVIFSRQVVHRLETLISFSFSPGSSRKFPTLGTCQEQETCQKNDNIDWWEQGCDHRKNPGLLKPAAPC